MWRRALLLAILPVLPALSAAPCAAARLELIAIREWSEKRPDFGGFSGLVMAPDGSAFHAVTDHGMLYHARIARRPDGTIGGIATDWARPLLDAKGRPAKGFTGDAEALAPDGGGGLIVAFESYARIARVVPPDMAPQPLSRWDRFRDLWGNEGFESVLRLPDGRLMVILEAPRDGHYPTLVARGGDWGPGPPLPAPDDFHAADAALGPDGRVYLLERRFGFLRGFETRIRRFDPPGAGGWRGAGELLLQTPPGRLDNMEGISPWRDAAGRTVLTMISDSNFHYFRPTYIVEYRLIEDAEH